MPDQTTKQNLIQELGLADLPEAKQIELLNLVTETLLKRITIEVLEKLSDKDQKGFDKVREAGDPDKMAEFLRGKIKGYDQMVEKIVAEFKEDMKKDLQNM